MLHQLTTRARARTKARTHTRREVDYPRRQQHSKKLDRNGDSEPETYMTKPTSTRESKGEGRRKQHEGTDST
ncbi:hypothetical protein OH77DRAFT_1023228 [Trametes cingulata]|nr:hypothetical protein OH77DRAFT_1023228 [Trametes cingulata]